MDKAKRREYNKQYRTQIVICPQCKKQVKRGQLSRHKESRKCKNYNNKTDTAGSDTMPVTSPGKKIYPSSSPVVSEPRSKILKEINMNKEFDKMAEKFKGASSDAEKEKKYKYKCGDCGEYFNLPAEGNKCPFCGQ